MWLLVIGIVYDGDVCYLFAYDHTNLSSSSSLIGKCIAKTDSDRLSCSVGATRQAVGPRGGVERHEHRYHKWR